MPHITEPLALTIPEACRAIGIGRTKIYQLAAEGKIRLVKLGKRTVIPTDCLRALLASGCE